MIKKLIKLSLKFLIKFGAKFVLLLFRVGKNLMREWIIRSGECGEPYLTYLCSAASSVGFAGAVISVLSSVPLFSGAATIGVCLNVLGSSQICSLVVGKSMRYLGDLEILRMMVFITEEDLKKIGADRPVDCVCENSWILIIRVGFVVPLCMAHYVWQCAEIQVTKVEIGFVALFLVIQLLQLRYWSVSTRLYDVSSMFEIYVFNAQNRLKKKWQSSVLCRVQSQLKLAQGVLSSLHSNQRELAVTYYFLVFSTLSSYMVFCLGFDMVSEHSFTGSSQLFQLIFIVLTENDLRMMWDSNKSTLKKIFNVAEMLTQTTSDQTRSVCLWRGKHLRLKNFLRIKYLKNCLAHATAMVAAVHMISFYLNSQSVSERSIKQFESPTARSS